MLPETFPHRPELFEPLLRVVSLALQHYQRPGEFIGHFRAASLELFLTAAQFLELALLFLDLFLLTFELEQLLLRFLHLRIEMLCRKPFFLVQFKHLFDRSDFF